MSRLVRTGSTRQSEILRQDYPEREQPYPRQFFFLSDYAFGGCQTFTAHLLRTLNRSLVMRLKGTAEAAAPSKTLRGILDMAYSIKIFLWIFLIVLKDHL